MYDSCAYSKRLDESVGPLAYMLNPIKFENCKKCRHEKGLVGGTAVSHSTINLVDVENDLLGITREQSLCPSKKYQFESSAKDTKVHLPACQMIHYKKHTPPPAVKLQRCVKAKKINLL